MQYRKRNRLRNPPTHHSIYYMNHGKEVYIANHTTRDRGQRKFAVDIPRTAVYSPYTPPYHGLYITYYTTHYYYMLETTTKLSMLFQVLVLWLHLKEIFLGLRLTVTEINIKKVQKQDLKKPKMMYRDGMPKSIQTR